MSKWLGIFKVIEEAGELQQILGKLLAFPDGIYPDEKKTELIEKTEKELGDVLATISYLIMRNDDFTAALSIVGIGWIVQLFI